MEITERKNVLESATSGNGQKNKAIDLAVQAIEKQFGKGSIMRLGVNETLVAQDVPLFRQAL